MGPNSLTETTGPNRDDGLEGRSEFGSLNNGFQLYSVPITFGSQLTTLEGTKDGSHNVIDVDLHNKGKIQVQGSTAKHMDLRNERNTQVQGSKAKVGQSSMRKKLVRPNRSPMQVEPVATNNSGKKRRLHESFDGTETGVREDTSKHPQSEGYFATKNAITVEAGHQPHRAQ